MPRLQHISVLRDNRARWGIAILLLAVAMINYLDRLTLSVLMPTIRTDLHLADRDYALIVSLFLVAYSLMYAVSGWIVDRCGARASLALFVLVWSSAQTMHAFITGRRSLLVLRFLVGLAEPGSFPAALKAIREWFPVEQRALGMGLMTAGTALGAMISAPFAGIIAIHYGWRAAFFATGAIGLPWTAAWLYLYRLPSSPTATALVSPRAAPHWAAVLKSRPCAVIMAMKLLTDPVIYFVNFWLPSYLQKERGFDLGSVAKYAFLPYVFGGVGYLLGGWFSGYLLQRGWSLGRARKTALVIGACYLPMAILAPLAPSGGLAIALICVMVFGHSLFGVTLLTLPADLFEREAVGTASGLMGMSGSIGSIFTTMAIGYVVSLFTYRYIFLVAGLLHIIAVALALILLPNRYFSTRAQYNPSNLAGA